MSACFYLWVECQIISSLHWNDRLLDGDHLAMDVSFHQHSFKLIVMNHNQTQMLMDNKNGVRLQNRHTPYTQFTDILTSRSWSISPGDMHMDYLSDHFWKVFIWENTLYLVCDLHFLGLSSLTHNIDVSKISTWHLLTKYCQCFIPFRTQFCFLVLLVFNKCSCTSVQGCLLITSGYLQSDGEIFGRLSHDFSLWAISW